MSVEVNAVDPAAVGGSVATASGLQSAYAHSSQDYVRAAREVQYHAQPLMSSPLTSAMPDGQGRPSSTQTLYNPVASNASQYETNSSQSAGEGISLEI